jgi:membrane-associated protease RseP (regulator of RpoE activity)
MLIGFVVLVMGGFAVDVAINFQARKATVLFMVLLWFPLLALHEAGHAVAARFYGCHVDRVVLGFGRELGRFRVGGVLVIVHMIPIEGFVRFSTAGVKISRFGRAMTYFAGCGAELLVLAALMLAIGPTTLFTASDYIPLLIAQSVAVVIIMGAVFNLVPHYARSHRDHPANFSYTPNDGLGIVLSLMGRFDDQ